jgi:hypothetical protein
MVKAAIVAERTKELEREGKTYDSGIGEGWATLKIDGITIFMAPEAEVQVIREKEGMSTNHVISLNRGFPEAARQFLDESLRVKKGLSLEDREFSSLNKNEQNALLNEAKKYVAIARYIDSLKAKKLIVHCNQGRTRTPIIVAAYLLFTKRQTNVGEVLTMLKEQIQKDRPRIKGVLGEHGNKMVNVLEKAFELMEEERAGKE